MDPNGSKEKMSPPGGRIELELDSRPPEACDDGGAAQEDVTRVVAAFIEACAVPTAQQVVEWCERYPGAREAIVEAAIVALDRDLIGVDPHTLEADERDIAFVEAALDRAAAKTTRRAGRGRGAR